MTDPAEPPPRRLADAILRHAEAEHAAAVREARKWHAVILALGGNPPRQAADADDRSN